MVMVGVSVRDM